MDEFKCCMRKILSDLERGWGVEDDGGGGRGWRGWKGVEGVEGGGGEWRRVEGGWKGGGGWDNKYIGD